MATSTVSHHVRNRGLSTAPAELIHSQNIRNEGLKPFLVRGRELSNPDPAYMPYFFMLSEEARDALLRKVKIVKYVNHCILADKGHYNPQNLYLIFSGVLQVASNGKERVYRIRESHPNHSEFAVLPSELVASSIIYVENTEFSILTKSHFINWLLNCPDVSFGYLGGV